jgi:hypothetical protein
MQILGVAELWAGQIEDAERHLERAVVLAHRISCPMLEIGGLAHLAIVACLGSFTLGAQRGMQAIELARRHGWSEEPFVAVAYVALAAASVNTVKAHVRHLYAKLGVNSRGEAVERARALSLLAPSSRKR